MRNARHRFGIRVLSVSLIIAGITAVPMLTTTDETAAAAELTAPAPTTAVEIPERPSEVASAEAVSFDAAAWSDAAMGGVNPEVFALALSAANAAVGRGDAEPSTLTVIDFSQPSTAERMWVYDLRTRALLFHELVAHGRNSGQNLTTSFSNLPESNKSSLGLYRTGEGYIGKHGYSLRLDGLERGFNDRARERAIVIHGADYVNGRTANSQGRLGRSLGCPAVRPEISGALIDAIKGGGLVFAYYPDPAWLAGSRYLN